MKIKLRTIKANVSNESLIKSAVALVCVVGFIANSFLIFKQFIAAKRTTSQDIQSNEKLALPSVTICGSSAYKQEIEKYDDIELDNYLNNTLDLEEVLVSVIDPFDRMILLKDMYKNATHWDITTTYSLYRGRCYTLRYKQEVMKLNIYNIPF